MRRHHQLYGLLMRPCSLTQEEHSKTIHSSEHAVKHGFKETYENHMAAMQIVAESAKIYILNNWEKIADWTDLTLSCVDNTGKETYYYNHIPEKYDKKEGAGSKMFAEMHNRIAKDHNPIKTIQDVVLDTSDGDFSLTINGNQHMWVDDHTVIVLADFIEEVINKKTLIINGKEIIYFGTKINVKTLKRLAKIWGEGYSITFNKGPKGFEEGMIIDPDKKEDLQFGRSFEGESVEIIDGMIFNIIKPDKA